MVPRNPHMPNKDTSMDRLKQIALSTESCFQSIRSENRTFDERWLDKAFLKVPLTQLPEVSWE